MKFSMKISLALLLLILLFTFCIYIHTQSIHEDMNQRKNIIAAENATQESVKIAIDKKDKDIYFSASLDSQDAYDMLDDRLTDATHSITRVVKINENLKNSDKVISLVSKLIDILKKYYEYGSITYKDGMLVFDGITHDEEAKSKIDLILSASLIPSVDRSSYEKKFVEMSYPKLSEEAQVLEVRMNEIAEVEDIIFEESSAKLTIKSLDTINKIAQILKENNTYTIEISGHTDSVGDPEYNLELSKQRALSVKGALMKQGVDAKKMVANGYGDQRPLVDNNNEEDRKKNRRVEFKIIGE